MKRDLIISVLAILAFLAISLNVCVFASTSLENPFNTSFGTKVPENTQTGNQTIETVNTNNSSANNNTNTPGQLADTGLENPAWIVIGICAVTAVFAYAKIKEYKAY